MIYVFILLVSPWYMYKGSCFRDVCADTVVVGGYLKGSIYWGVYIYIYYVYINTYPFYIIVQGQVKRLLSVNHVLSRTCKFNWALWKFREKSSFSLSFCYRS